MSSINVKKVHTTSKKESFEGGTVWKPDPKTQLYLKAATFMFGEDAYYQSHQSRLDTFKEIFDPIAKIDPNFVLDLVYYMRHELHVRTASVWMLVRLAYLNRETGMIKRKDFADCIGRADEILEALAISNDLNKEFQFKSKMPNMVRHGLNLAFARFTPYQIMKYRSSKNKVAMRDAIKLLHPAPNSPELDQAYRNCIDNTAGEFSENTWENIISLRGSNQQSWDEAVVVMPYMATLRNLRNIISNCSDASFELAMRRIRDPDLIKRSKLYPFRFWTALEQIEVITHHREDYLTFEENERISHARSIVSHALEQSADNLPRIEGRTLVIVDISGSMSKHISTKSTVACRDIARIMGAIAHKIFPQSRLCVFAEGYDYIQLDRDMTITDRVKKIMEIEPGGATYIEPVFRDLVRGHEAYDRIVVLSDMQIADSNMEDTWNRYKEIAPNCKLYSVDLVGYTDIIVRQNRYKIMDVRTISDPNVYPIAGWSEGIFKYIAAMEESRKYIDVPTYIRDKVKSIKNGG